MEEHERLTLHVAFQGSGLGFWSPDEPAESPANGRTVSTTAALQCGSNAYSLPNS